MDSGRRTYHLRDRHLSRKDPVLPASSFGRSQPRRSELPRRQARRRSEQDGRTRHAAGSRRRWRTQYAHRYPRTE